MRTAKALVLGCFAVVGLSLTSVNVQAAVTGFQPGRIIDDTVFTDTTTMSVEDIQRFLNSKVPVCDTWGTQPYGGTTRAAYAASRGYSTPFTCLKDFSENGKSAAQIIFDVGKQYRINPQTLIVLLQKEQALVTDDWPWSIQYRAATGYGCPDTADCDAQYYGFTNQVSWAAKMFRRILDNDPNWYTPYILGNNYIQYNPVAACGGSMVNIQNRATQALYNYTPYQPNQAALNADWGMADCGAYGNRNFYLYFTSWFGSTHAADYSWQLVSQYAYTDESKTTPANLSKLVPGQRVYIGFTARNSGNVTWSNTGNNPIRVGTAREIARSSVFADQTWLGPSRPGAMKEASVAPGGTATFEFWMTAPAATHNEYKEYFTLLAESRAWMPDVGMYFGMRVESPRYTWQLLSQYAYTDDTKTAPTGLYNQYPGEKKYVGMQIKNTGNITWKNTGANPMRLGITRPMERLSPFMAEGWLGASRPATMKEASVAPGESATFEFWMKAPSHQSGQFREYFSPLIEGKLWLEDIGLNFAASVVSPTYTWELTSQYAFADDSKTTAIGLHNLTPNQRVYVGFKARNTGNVPWFNDDARNPVDVGTTNPIDRSSKYCTAGWLGCNRPARLQEAVVYPGQEGTFEFWLQAPATPGTYLEYFNLVAERAAWMNTFGFNYAIRVL